MSTFLTKLKIYYHNYITLVLFWVFSNLYTTNAAPPYQKYLKPQTLIRRAYLVSEEYAAIFNSLTTESVSQSTSLWKVQGDIVLYVYSHLVINRDWVLVVK